MKRFITHHMIKPDALEANLEAGVICRNRPRQLREVLALYERSRTARIPSAR